MATGLNLRYCQVLHGSTYYDIMIAVTDLDQVNDILQEWALTDSGPGEALTLPAELIINTEAKDINLISKDIDTSVYIKSAISAYMDEARNAGVSGTFPTLPKILVALKYVMPACTVRLYTGTDFTGVFGEYSIDSLGLDLVENQVNYIGVTYNSGTPIYAVYTSQSSFNYSNIIPVCAVSYFDSEINVIPMGTAGDGLPEKLLLNQTNRKEFDIITDFTLAEGADLYVELSALTVSNGVEEVDCLAMDSETADNDLWLAYLDATSTWTYSQSNTINNTQYQGAGLGLQTLGSGKFVINYLFRAIDDTNLLMFNVLSASFDSLALAKDSDMLTDLPDLIKESCVLVGRFIVEKDSSAPTVQKIQRINPFATVV
jgi:hypothetical protein